MNYSTLAVVVVGIALAVLALVRLARWLAHRDSHGARAWRAGLLSGVALTIIAIASAVIVAGDFTGETPPEASPTDESPDESFATTTTSTEPDPWQGYWERLLDEEPRCSWGHGSLQFDADIGFIGVLFVRPECWPGFGADELWWLAVSQTLADAWEKGGPEPWRRRLLAICTDLDTAVGINSLGRPLINPAALAYALHRRLADSFIAEGQLAESEEAWQLARLRWATVIAEDMASRAGLAWKYTALTATGLYCPEHQTHLRRHRDERLTLETTVRRCATSRDGWCLHLKDVAATPRLLETLEALAEFEAEVNAREG